MDVRHNEAAAEKQLVVFNIKQDEYAFDIYYIREVLKMVPVTPLAQQDSVIEGIINFRGEVIPVIDLRRLFGNSKPENTAETRIIIKEFNGNLLGIIVDAVNEVLKVAVENISPPPTVTGGSGKDFIEGIVKVDNRLIIIIKTESLFSTEAIQDECSFTV
ncbi:MAG TPA: purine-binding chemotaxis protein CheW [Firmicutes bacterium]|nr:purine-binding chemotaxis protein CheW [Bacillota bacterium]